MKDNSYISLYQGYSCIFPQRNLGNYGNWQRHRLQKLLSLAPCPSSLDKNSAKYREPARRIPSTIMSLSYFSSEYFF
ncbi:Uncharacterised protein [Segatella copri]|nr:Uncharacterised protein [Segatella copri]